MQVDLTQHLRILAGHTSDADLHALALDEQLRLALSSAFRPVAAGSAECYFYAGKVGADADADADEEEEDDEEEMLQMLDEDEDKAFWKEELFYYALQSQRQQMSIQPPTRTGNLLRKNAHVGVYPFPFFLVVDSISKVIARAAPLGTLTSASVASASALSSSSVSTLFSKGNEEEEDEEVEELMSLVNGEVVMMLGGGSAGGGGSTRGIDQMTTSDNDTDATDATDAGEDTDTGTESGTNYGSGRRKVSRRFSDTDTDDSDARVRNSLR